jgi:hypothetical protein
MKIDAQVTAIGPNIKGSFQRSFELSLLEEVFKRGM